MDYVRFGRSNLRVSRIALGAMGFGSPSWRKWVLPEAQARPIIRHALEAGINLVDTCDYYSDGASEEVLGAVLWEHARRDEIVLATKAGNPMGSHANARGFSRKHLFAAIDASLRRLRTDHVDLFQTHIWAPATDLDELAVAFGDIVRSGKALYVGATTMPAWAFVRTIGIARHLGQAALCSMQCEYNLCHREAERELIPFCRDDGIAVIPFSPLARGFLCADRREASHTTARHESDDYTLKHYHRPGDHRVQQAVARIADGRGVTPAQIALAWVLRQPGITAPILGATSVSQLQDAMAGLSVTLTAEETGLLEAEYAPRPPRSGS
ncbi:MAG: aldo/keto reductase [Acidisphaera sp.]|nr:aldo/keto reductase [Acidisphaera sp.]